jgi:hypothetical protein
MDKLHMISAGWTCDESECNNLNSKPTNNMRTEGIIRSST